MPTSVGESGVLPQPQQDLLPTQEDEVQVNTGLVTLLGHDSLSFEVGSWGGQPELAAQTG
jgi:hypothetical protein